MVSFMKVAFFNEKAPNLVAPLLSVIFNKTFSEMPLHSDPGFFYFIYFFFRKNLLITFFFNSEMWNVDVIVST